jgi:hypothetical protein
VSIIARQSEIALCAIEAFKCLQGLGCLGMHLTPKKYYKIAIKWRARRIVSKTHISSTQVAHLNSHSYLKVNSAPDKSSLARKCARLRVRKRLKIGAIYRL